MCIAIVNPLQAPYQVIGIASNTKEHMPKQMLVRVLKSIARQFKNVSCTSGNQPPSTATTINVLPSTPRTAFHDTTKYLPHTNGNSTRAMLTVCSNCKRIYGEDGQWIDIVDFRVANADPYKFTYSHGYCIDCYNSETDLLELKGANTPTTPRDMHGAQNTPSTPSKLSSSHRPSIGKVLVVDDNALQRKIIKRMVEKAGFECDLATNGDQAIEMATRTSYSLILMDCMMGDTDGWVATSKIRSIESEKELIIVAVTGLTTGEDQDLLAKCLEAGMNDVVQKPLTDSTLRTILSKVRS